MPDIKVLYADDHYPDFDLPTDDKQALAVVRAHHHRRYPDSEMPKFLSYHRYCKGLFTTLKDANFYVKPVSHYDEAIEEVKNNHFDIAIVDLGWFNDDLFRGSNPGSAGWDICNAIDERNKRLGDKPTLHIALSERFNNEQDGPELLSQAAKDGRLPFVRIENSPVNLKALKACTQFLQTTLDATSPAGLARRALSELEQIRNRYLVEPLRQLRTWSAAALVCVCLGFVIFLAGALRVVHRSLDVGVLTSLNGAISGAVAALFYQRLGKVQATLSKQLRDLRQDIAELWKKISELASAAPASRLG
jgi:hypothetical protein